MSGKRPDSWTEPKVLPGFLSRPEIDAVLAAVSDPSTVGLDVVPFDGRQGGGYQALALGTQPLTPVIDALTARSLELIGSPASGNWDRLVLLYPDGSSIRPHVDPPVRGGHLHLRLNALLAAPQCGGVLILDGAEVPLAVGDAVVFRPDVTEHQVTPVTGSRQLWSVGGNVPHP